MNKKEITPLYQKIISDLKKQIENGFYHEGDLLPSENELSRTYQTTRPTIRQALSVLISSGHIVRKHGKGSIVSEPKKGLGILSLKGVTAGIGIKSLQTTILHAPEKKRWPPNFFFDLEKEELLAGCIYFSRIRYIDLKPVLYEETFLTDLKLNRFTSRNLENKSLFKILEDHYQIKVLQGEQKIWAIKTDKVMSKLLEINPQEPLLHMKRKLKTNMSNVNIYSAVYCNTAEYFLQDHF